MEITSLSKNSIKKYPNYGYSDLKKVEDYITDKIKNHNHGRQFGYAEIHNDLNYPIDWLQLIFINWGHNGFILTEEEFLNRGGKKYW